MTSKRLSGLLTRKSTASMLQERALHRDEADHHAPAFLVCSEKNKLIEVYKFEPTLRALEMSILR